MYQKIGILVVLASVLLSAGLLATPSLKVTNAQENGNGAQENGNGAQENGNGAQENGNGAQENGNETQGAQGNQTKTIDVDGWITTLKENHPAMANIGEAQDVKDVIGKIQDIEGKEAVKELLALRVLKDLMDLKAAQEGQ